MEFTRVGTEQIALLAAGTILKKEKNREVSISHGIGHGGFEVMFILGMTYASYIAYAFMINSGAFGEIVEQVRAAAPDQVDQVYAIADQLASFSAGNLVINIVERVFAVMYHIGASILVFYACKEKKHFFLYPLAIVGCGTFFGAYFLLYKKDTMITAGAKEVSA